MQIKSQTNKIYLKKQEMVIAKRPTYQVSILEKTDLKFASFASVGKLALIFYTTTWQKFKYSFLFFCLSVCLEVYVCC